MARDTAGDSLTSATADDLFFVDADTVEAMRRDKIRQAMYAAKHEAKRGKRSHHKTLPGLPPFIAWDGEGPRDAKYALFGSSAGDELMNRNLGTEQCLELVLAREELQPDAIHIWYGSNYDVSMILKDMPRRCLRQLHTFTKTYWHGHEIEHIPHKWLKISKGGVTAKIFDIHSFFMGSYVTALQQLHVGTDEEIKTLIAEKARRSQFLWAEILDIREYWRLELRLMPLLAEKLRELFIRGGFSLRSWHGPGALANLAMRMNNVFDAMAVCPTEVRMAARMAFAGGRFEMFRGGHFRRRIYNADLNSAYPAYARLLPNLNRGEWRRTRSYEPGKFGVYHIVYRSTAKFSPHRPYPLFRRMEDGNVIWPHAVEGWYWGPEAELVCDDPDARYIDGWVFDENDPEDRPFRFIDEMYRRRQLLKRNGDILELTYKLIINAIYGQLAQRTGWDEKRRAAPRSHQLEWAGYITSSCRAAVYRAAVSAGSDLVSIDTDGIYATAPIRYIDCGDQLGQWGTDEYDDGAFFQSGIYSLKEKGGDWKTGKTRGIPRGQFSTDKLLEAIHENKSIFIKKKQFIGYGLALNGRWKELNTWKDAPSEVILGGTGKRFHFPRHCPCENDVHVFVPRPLDVSPRKPILTYPHFLPWLKNDPVTESKKRAISNELMGSLSDLDEDEEWMFDYVAEEKDNRKRKTGRVKSAH